MLYHEVTHNTLHNTSPTLRHHRQRGSSEGKLKKAGDGSEIIRRVAFQNTCQTCYSPLQLVLQTAKSAQGEISFGQ